MQEDHIRDTHRVSAALSTAEYHWIPGATDIDVEGVKDSQDSNDADVLPDVVRKTTLLIVMKRLITAGSTRRHGQCAWTDQ